MAGSLGHLISDDDNKGGWNLIENMGDAYECTEELLWLILRTMSVKKAHKLLNEEYYPMCRGEKPQDKALTRTRRVMEERSDSR